MTPPLIDIHPDHWAIVRDILQTQVPQYPVWAFGSRATWKAKEFSDLDLAIITETPLPLDVMASLREAFSDSDLPWKVDVVDWASTGAAFREIIERDKVVVQGWRKLQLGRVSLKIGSGATPRGGKDAYKGGKTALIRSQNIHNNLFNRDGLVYIDDTQAYELRSVEVQENDVLINITGDSVARCTSVDPKILPARVNQHVAIIRPRSDILDPKFLRFVLVSPSMQDHLLALASAGATRNALTKAMIESLTIDAPPVEEQRAIAHVLGTLDDKIDLNRRMNATLEAMARALFKDWFVDFGPTRAKLEGRAPYLPPDLWALFPDRLDEEGKPEGWETQPLDQIADFLNGLALQKFPPEGSVSLPVIKIAQLRSGNGDNADRASINVPNQYVIQDGDVLFSWSGSLMQRVWTAGPGALNQHLFKVTSDNYPKWFYYFWIDHYMPRFQAVAASKATTMGHIQRRHLTEATTCVAEGAIMAVADHLIGPLFAKMIENNLESRTLAQTRDVLLPKLMSGEISLKDTEAAAEKAL